MVISSNQYSEKIQDILSVGDKLVQWERNFIVRLSGTEFYRASSPQLKKLIELHERYFPE